MQCRVCDSERLELAIDLGNHPWCNHFLKPTEIGLEPFYPLRVLYCHDCATPQLDYTVKKEIMFGDHTYLSGMTSSLRQHFKDVAETIDQQFFKDKIPKRVLDIGSNDGTQLQCFQDLGYEVLGIESSKTTAKIANQNGIPTLNQFFNLEVAQSLPHKFQVINAAGVFFHLEELHSVTEGIRMALHEDGVFVVQFLYMKNIVDNLAFDQIYHEHLLYYTLKTVEALLNRHGLALFDASVSPIHGGSVIGYVTHQGKRPPSVQLQALRAQEDHAQINTLATYQAFAKRIQQMKADNLAFLDKAKHQGKTIFGFGAPVKGNTLLNYFGIGTQYLDCLVEKNELRQGLYSPGMHIPILLESELDVIPDIYYVLAWNFKTEILGRNQALIDQGVHFYFPVNAEGV